MDDEVSALVETLHQTGQRLEELTGGELDSVVDRSGRMFLMRGVQEQLRQAEAARQAAILSALPAHIALLDARGLIISVNETWRRFGVDNALHYPGHAVGVNYLDICDQARGDHADEAREVGAGIRSVLDGSAKTFSLEYPCHSPEEQRWFLMMVAPLPGDPPNGAVVMHLNITDRNLAEDAFRALSLKTERRERMLSTALSAMSDFAQIYDRDGRVMFVNQPLLDLWGLSMAGVSGKNFAELGYPDELARRLQQQLREVVETKNTIRDETAYDSPTGVEGYYEYIFSPAVAADGSVEFVVGSTRDVTGRKQIEQDLRRSESRFRSLTMLSSDWFWEQDEHHRFVGFSGGEGVEGWGPDQNKAVGMHRWELGGVVPISCSWEEHRALLDTHEPFRKFEYSRILGDGRLQYVETSGEPIFDVDGAFSGYRGVATEITGRKVAEKEQQRQQSELRVLFDLMPAMIWFKDTENRILRVNSRVADAAGMAVADIEGKPSADIYPQDAARFYADDLEVMRSGVSKLGYVESLGGPHGRQKWVETDKVPYFDRDGRVIGIVVMAQDVTERKQAEQDLQRFRTAMDSSGDAIVLVDRASMRYVDVNQTLCDMVGYTRQEIIGMTPMELFGTERTVLEREYDEVIAEKTGKSRILEGHYRHKNGALIPIETRRRAFHAGEGWIIVGSARDITERKRAGELMLREQHFTKSALDSLPGLFYLIDDQSRFLRWNKNFEAVSGYSAEEIAGLSPSDLFTGAEKQIVAEKMKQVFLTGEAAVEAEFVAKNLTRTPYLLTGKLVRIGQQACISGMGIDITVRTQAEQSLRRLNRVYAMLSGINALIVRVRDREELFREACRIAVEDGGFRMTWIGIPDRVAGKIVQSATAGGPRELQDSVRKLFSSPEGSLHGISLSARAMREMKPVLSNDMQSDPAVPFGGINAAFGVVSMAALPLVVSDEAVGVIVLYAREPDFFQEDELRQLTALAANIAFAIDHIDKETARKAAEAGVLRLNRVYAVLSGINSAIVRVRDRAGLFAEVCRIAMSEGGFSVVRVIEVDSNGKAGIAASTEPDSRELQRLVDQYNADPEGAPSLFARALRGGEPIVSNDVAGDPRIPDRAALTSNGNYALALLPIVIEKRVAGVVSLRAIEAGMFDDYELRLLLELVSNLSFALDLMDKRGKLEYLAYHDPLTGLANRALFHERLAQSVVAAQAQGRKFALVFLDIERFKTINDSLGRPAGDALIKAVADRTSGLVDAGRLARFDADHFAVMVPDLQNDEEVARRIEQRIGDVFGPPFRIAGIELRISAKFGIAMFPADGADADTLFRNAEAALKKAKSSGERYLFYTHSMNERVAEKLALENQLRQAIEKNEFVLHYQPKVNLDSGLLTGCEALIRWNDPRTGLVPPGRFIPILEETGLISEVGRWALRQAIADYLRWRDAGLPAVRIAVNVSPLQLRDRGFVGEIEREIGVASRAADGLELEITESLIMEDVQHSVASLQAIRTLGVTVAIDDFGTGYSSLSQLARLPVNTLKIDRSFILGMTVGPQGLALVSTVINLAHSLKLKVVAEGVETEEQSRILHLLRCDEMQGYLFSKPVPVDVFEAKFLARPAAG